MICSTCTSIFQGEPPTPNSAETVLWTVHHAKTRTFQSSAESGCQICSFLWDFFAEHYLNRFPQLPLRYKLPLTWFSFLPGEGGSRHFQSAVAEHTPFLIWFRISWTGEETNMKIAFDLYPYLGANCTSPSTPLPTPLLSEWLSDCSHYHHECSPSYLEPWFPTRLIDLGEDSSSLAPKIIETSEHALFRHTQLKKKTRYMTLSHCWGATQPVKLLTSNLKQMKDGLPMDQIPKTFSDAFLVTKSLGVQFLWIDSLCIMQDSKDDWLRESASMGKVYGAAYCSIAATGASDSSKGLFFSNQQQGLEYSLCNIAWLGLPEREYLVLGNSEIWSDRFEQLPLNCRGWAVQERVLAPRILNFLGYEIIWECRRHAASDYFPDGIPQPFQKYHHHRNDLVMGATDDFASFWAHLVRTYTQTLFTFPSDRLTAISGLRSELHSRNRVAGRYFAGMWESQLPQSLLWARGDMYPEAYNPRRMQQYRAPSWSWASLECPVDMAWAIPRPQFSSTLASARVIEKELVNLDVEKEANFSLSIRGPFGMVTWAKKLSRVQRIKDPDSYGVTTVARLQSSLSAATKLSTSSWNVIIFDALDEDEPPALLWCISLYSGATAYDFKGDSQPESYTRGLVLVRLDNGQFKRVGVFSVAFPDGESLATLPSQTVVLV